MDAIKKPSIVILITILSLSFLVPSCAWFFFKKEVAPIPVTKFGPWKVFSFSEKDALKEWEEKVFRDRTSYLVEYDGDEGFLHAKSEQSASGYYYRIEFDAEEYPLMSWRWKAVRFPKKRGFRDIEEDDYAARVYVIFLTRFFPLSKCLEYVWDETIPEGTIFSHPRTKNIKLFVVQSGKNKRGEWVFEERNIYEDYLKAFGGKPRTKVGAVAFMSDSDNTMGSVEAFYDEIKVGYKKEADIGYEKEGDIGYEKEGDN